MKKTVIYKGLTLQCVSSPLRNTGHARIRVATGRYNEPDGYHGISHVLEHMVMLGTNNQSSEDVSKYFSSLGISANACTTECYTEYYITGPAEHIPEACIYLSNMVAHPKIGDSELKNELKVVAAEILDRESKADYVVWDQCGADIFDCSSPVAGKVKEVNHYSAGRVNGYHKLRYTRNNVMAIAVLPESYDNGPMDLFSPLLDLPTSSVDGHQVPTFDPLGDLRRNYRIGSGNMVNKITAYHPYSIGSREETVSDLYTEALGEGTDSVLYKEVRKNRGLCYSIGAANYSNSPIIMYTAERNNESKIDSVIERIALEAMRTLPIQDFNRIKDKRILQLKMEQDSPEAMADTILCNWLWGIEKTPEQRIEDMQSVTLNEVQDWADLVASDTTAVWTAKPKNRIFRF